MNDTTHWDAIVIGSGLGGLAAAAAFANKGKRVLVLERLANFGGAATVYRHGLLFAGVWSRYVESGSYYFKGGSSALSRALLKQVKESAGEAHHHCSVASIVLDAKDRAAGVPDQSSGHHTHAATCSSLLRDLGAPAGLAGSLALAQSNLRLAHAGLPP
jgi:phytoene dehydrogenase-like protein